MKVNKNKTGRVSRTLTALAAAVAVAALPAGASADSASDNSQFSVTPGTLAFDAAPNVPNLSGLALNGQAQTVSATMSDWTVVDATGSGSGWNVSAQGESGSGKSPVFKEYCTDGDSANGCDTAVAGGPGPGYVTSSPKSLSANSLTLTSTGAGFNPLAGTTGTAPTHTCGSGCNVDSASPVKVASAASNAGMGTYQAASYDAASLGLTVPTTTKAIGTGNKAYRVDLLWTLSSGP